MIRCIIHISKICIVHKQHQKCGLTGTGHAAQEQEPDALETVESQPTVQILQIGTISLPAKSAKYNN
jgi:hypothetical protein